MPIWMVCQRGGCAPALPRCERMAYDDSDQRLRGRKLQAARLRIWAKDPHCAKCRQYVEYPGGFELDHIRAVSTSTDKKAINADANLQILCIHVDEQGSKTGCHVDKTARDLGQRARVAIGIDGWPEG